MTMDTLSIQRYENLSLSPLNDQVGVETILELVLETGEILRQPCTAIHLEELIAGILFSRSHVSSSDPAPFSKMDYERLLAAFKSFGDASPLFRKTGSVHSGQLLDENFEVLFFTEDMGRHNVMDKLIGFGVIHEIRLQDCLVMISSRMPLELTEIALHAGITRIASISAPTREAVLYARKNKMNLIGMFRGSRFNVYAGEEEE